MKKMFSIFLLTCILLASCGKAFEPETPSVSESASVEESILPSEAESSSESETPEENGEYGGTSAECTEHTYTYHAVDGVLVDYVGQERVHEWYDSISGTDEYNRVNEDFNILSFIQEFDIPKEKFIELTQGSVTDSLLEALEISYDEYLEEYGYTDSQIDALYSGDQAKINEAFCGEMACYNPKDGKLYSIYWLSDHTAEDYDQAGIYWNDIHRIIDTATEAGGVYAKLAEKAAPAVKEFDSDIETCRPYTPCTEHVFSYHYITTSLLNYVGQSTFNEWIAENSEDEYGRAQEWVSIQSFIEHFDVPREVFEEIINTCADNLMKADPTEDREKILEENGYTDAQIDALYSGDQAKINEAFCGDMAYYNPEDGEHYSIYWLSDHTAEEYESAGIPETEVERILGLAEEAGGGYARFAEEAGEAAAEYAAMN